MAVVDTLVTKYVMQSSDYEAGASKVIQSTGVMGGVIGGLQTAAVAAFAAIGAAAIGAGVAMQKGMQLEQQTQALSLYADQVNTTEVMLKKLREVAKLPGLGNMEAIQGAVKLMAGGFNFDMATRSMMAFGNAIASAGGSKEDLGGVLTALTQIAAKGKVSAEEINQIAERVPQIRTAMIDAFGTADTEALQKMGITSAAFIAAIVTSLEKIPKAKETFLNTLSNIGDFADTALGQIGMGINSGISEPLQDAARFGEYLVDSGIFKQIGTAFNVILGMGGDGSDSPIVTVMAYLVSALGEIPMLMGEVGLAAKYIWKIITAGMENLKNSLATILETVGGPAGALMANGLRNFKMQDIGAIVGGMSGDAFGRHMDNIHKNAQNLISGFGEQSALGGVGAAGMIGNGPATTGTPGPQSELEKQTQHLAAIERNTSPEQRNSVLGGGNLGAKGISAVELSDMKRGGSKLDRALDMIKSAVGEIAAEQAQSMLKNARRFGV